MENNIINIGKNKFDKTDYSEDLVKTMEQYNTMFNSSRENGMLTSAVDISRIKVPNNDEYPEELAKKMEQYNTMFNSSRENGMLTSTVDISKIKVPNNDEYPEDFAKKI